MRSLAIVLALTLALAGCANKADSKDQPGPGETSESILPAGVTNVLEGIVQSNELGPLEGVVIKLDASNQTRTTDAAGYYRFESLEPRDYIVIATYDGFKAKTQRAVVEDEKVFQLDFLLEPIPVAQPYFESVPFTGLIECQAHYQTNEDSPNRPTCGPGADPNAAPTHVFPVGPGAAQIQIEVIWEAQTAAASHLTISATHVGDDTELAYAHAESILRVAISENVVRKYYGQGGEVKTTMMAGPSITGDEAAADVGLAFEQEYTIWFTVFYHEIGPPTFSAIPE